MHNFLYGLQWGTGFWLSVFVVGGLFLVILAGLVGLANIGKGLKRPPVEPTQ